MTRISNLPRVTSIDDTGLLVFVNGASEPISIDSGETVSMTFADFKLSVVDQLNTITGPVNSGIANIPLFGNISGDLLIDSGVNFGSSIGDAIVLVNVGGQPGLPAVDGSLLTNITVPDISSLVTGPTGAIADSLPIYDGATGFIIKQGPEIGVLVGNVIILEGVASLRSFTLLDNGVSADISVNGQLEAISTSEFVLTTGSSIPFATQILMGTDSIDGFLVVSGGVLYQDSSTGQILSMPSIGPSETHTIRLETTETFLEVFIDNVSEDSAVVVGHTGPVWDTLGDQFNSIEGTCISDILFDDTLATITYAVDETSGDDIFANNPSFDVTWAFTPDRKTGPDTGGSTPGLPAVDGSQLLNLPGVITSTPSTTVIGNITTWGGTLGTELLDSTVPVSQIIVNTSNISDNQNDIGVNKADITTNADDILTKLDKSTNDGIFYGQKNGAIFVPNTSEVDDSTDRRYVLDSDLAKLVFVPPNTSAEIGTKQDRSPVDATLYGLLDSILEPITIAVIPGLTAALDGKQDISPVDGVTYGLLDGGIVAIVSGSGDVVGPASSIDNAIVIFNGTTGKIIADSTVLFGVAISNALQVANVGGQPGLPALDGSLLTNLPSQPAEDLQVTYDASTQPQISIDASGSLQLREGLNVGTNLILEGLNFASTPTFTLDGDGVLNATILKAGSFSADSAGVVVGVTFNGVALSTSAGDRNFLTGTGSYEEIALYQLFSFIAATDDSDPGSGIFKYNNAAAASTTFIFMSNFQNGGLDISTILLAGLSAVNITDRETPGVAHLFAVTGAIIAATGYVKIPVTLTSTAGSEMTVNGDLSVNLVASAGASSLQDAYDFSVQPQIVISGLGSLQLKEGLNDGTNLILEGLNFGDTTTFSVDGDGLVVGTSFNGVALTDAGDSRSFLAEDGTYAKIETINQYFFNGATSDTDPGNGQVAFNNTDPSLVTEIYISKLNGGALDVSSALIALTEPDQLSFTGRANNTKSQSYIVSDLLTDNTTYITIPVTLLVTVGSIHSPGDEINAELNTEPSLQRSINLEASSKILEGGTITIEAPGTPSGESFSVESGVARIIASDGTEMDIPFGPFVAQVFTEMGETAFLFINSVGALIQRDLTMPADFRVSALLGFIARTPAGQLTGAVKFLAPPYQSWAQFADLGLFLSGASDANLFISSFNPTTDFQNSEGEGFVFLGNAVADINNPHIISVPAQTPSTWTAYYFNGNINSTDYVGDGTDTILDPTLFDDLSGGLIDIPGSPQMAQIFRIFWQPNAAGGAQIRVIHGQEIFDSIAEALNNLASYSPIIPAAVDTGAVDLGGIVARKGSTDWQSTGDAIFFRASEVTGGGGGSVTQNLDETYLNSTPALITINAVNDQVIIQDGTAVATQLLFDVLDFSGSPILSVDSESVAIGGAIASAERSLNLISTTQVMSLNTINTAAETAVSKFDGDLWFNSQESFYKVFEFADLRTIQTMTVGGDVNTVPIFDAQGRMVASTLQHTESATCWFLQNRNVGGTGTLALGFNTNFANSDTLRSTLLGQNTAVNLGDGNNDITVVGRSALNAAIPDGAVMNNIVGMGGSVWSSLTGGSNSAAIGHSCGNNITNAINSFILGGLNIANSTTTLFNCGFYGVQSLGPAGPVVNYLNFHQTMQMELQSDTVTIGDVNNTKPADLHYSLHLMTDNQVLGTNVLTTASSDGLTILDGDFWYDSDLNKFMGGVEGITKVIKSNNPNGFVSWVNGYSRLNSSTIRIFGPITATSSDDTFDIELSGDFDINTNTSGFGGVDTGVIADSTWYDIYMVADSAMVNPTGGVLVLRGNAITLPAGYDKFFKLFMIVTNTASAWFVQNVAVLGNTVQVDYDVSDTNNRLLIGGTDAVYTDIDLIAFIPEFAKVKVFTNVDFDTTAANSSFGLRPGNGSQVGAAEVLPGFITTVGVRFDMDVLTDTEATVQYIINNLGTATLRVRGFSATIGA